MEEPEIPVLTVDDDNHIGEPRRVPLAIIGMYDGNSLIKMSTTPDSEGPPSVEPGFCYYIGDQLRGADGRLVAPFVFPTSPE